MRTKKSKINIITALIGQLTNSLLAIFSRAVLASIMPAQYLGINGLFTNILTILSLAELGIGSAMMFAFYEPAAQENKPQLQKLMNLYRRLYWSVAAAIAVFGVLLIPFLDYLIKSDTEIRHLTLIYCMYLLQSVSSYFFVYKTVIIQAHQDEYILNVYQMVSTGLRYMLQIVVLFLTKNFYLYLAVHILFNLLPNILASKRAEREYPYICENRNVFPTKEEQRDIFSYIRATFLHKVGSVMVYNVDDLIMSAFVGLGTVGIYSNYKLISSNVNSFISRAFGSMTSSIGNLTATECDNQEKLYRVFSILQLVLFFLYSYTSVCLAILYRPFIRLFFGDSYVFPTSTMLLIVALYYLSGMRTVVQQFNSSMGLLRHDKYKSLAEAVFNLTVSLILVKYIGLNGVFIGTILDLLLLPYVIEPFVLFKYGIYADRRKHMFAYYRIFLFRTMLMILCGYLVFLAVDRIHITGIQGFVIQGMACTILYGLFMLICYMRNDRFRELLSYVVKMLRK